MWNINISAFPEIIQLHLESVILWVSKSIYNGSWSLLAPQTLLKEGLQNWKIYICISYGILQLLLRYVNP